MLSTVFMGKRAGDFSGGISQHNLGCCSLVAPCSTTLCLSRIRDRAVNFFEGGNISSTASDAWGTFCFFQLHSMPVPLKLWMA